MTPAPLLPNEAERLAALRRYDILDTPAEADFDDFTRLASQICGTPIALVSLVDAGRQWFKSKVGLAASETPREEAFCAHAIQGGGLLEVPNALDDERFRDLPLVAGETGVRFYAGAPLVTPDGLAIGALCVMDRVPRHLTPIQREMLAALSRQVMHLLELRFKNFHLSALNERLEQRVTERTSALLQSEREHRSAFERAAVGMAHVSPSGPFLRANPLLCELSGYTEAELQRKNFMDLAHPDDVAAELEGVGQLLRGEVPNFTMEKRMICKDGRQVLVQITASLVREPDESVAYILGFVEDISLRKEAELNLSTSEKHLRAVLQSANDAIVSADAQGRIASWNHGAQAIFGYALEEVISQPLTVLMPDRYREAHQSGMRRYLSSGKAQVIGKTVELHGLRKDGSEFPLELSLATWSTEAGSFFTGILRDITQRKLAEAEIEKLALVARETDNTVILTDTAGRIEWVNAGFTRLTGYPLDEIKGRKPGSFLQGPNTNPETVRLVRERLAEGKAFNVEIINYSKAGREYWVEVRVQPLHDEAGKLTGFFSINSDITARKQAERQTLRTQRLESIGTLAGGVAHDLNNTLAPILMGVELLRMQYPAAPELVNTMETSAKRGADMVRQLLTFAKGVEGERLPVQSQRLLKEMEKLMRGTFPKHIQLRTSYPSQPLTILGDATQLHQVLLNLCVNARDAMPSGGTLTLTAEGTEVDATYASTVPEAKPGAYVVWRVTDTGTGIPAELLERIFEPFFSTKGPDKGTGLGLSTLIGIVKSHGGFVRVDSVPGQGSTFAVYLPASSSSTGDTALLTKDGAAFRGNGETILVVDDEPAVRDVARSVLTALNFRVLTAADGTEALIQVAEKQMELRLVITDMHMPNMDGLAFVRVLKHMLPAAGVIVTSGRLDERTANEFRTLGVTTLLDKPFTQHTLVEALKTVFGK